MDACVRAYGLARMHVHECVRACGAHTGFHLQQLRRHELVGAAQCVHVGEETDPVARWQLRYAPVLPLPPIPTYAHSPFRPFPLGASGRSPRMHLEAGQGGAGRGRDITSLDVTAAASSASSGGG
jgi:hypothetical protein